ncbi:MAG: HAD family hydrolase [Lachnospiraceae bacterium]|nr:HAD family hydrolase [Lachnospiraceae bacterium]
MDKVYTDGIIFDMDGTIWDNTGVFAASWRRACLEDGFDVNFTADLLKSLFGKTMTDIADACIPSDDLEKRYAALRKCEKYEMDDLRKSKENTCYPLLHETIRALCKRIPLYIVSNCQSGYIETFLEMSGLGDCFTDYICYGDNGLVKAENIQIIVNKHGLKAPVYVGDIQGDKDSCVKAGVDFIWASYGYGKSVDAYKAKISAISELEQLCEMVER